MDAAVSFLSFTDRFSIADDTCVLIDWALDERGDSGAFPMAVKLDRSPAFAGINIDSRG